MSDSIEDASYTLRYVKDRTLSNAGDIYMYKQEENQIINAR